MDDFRGGFEKGPWWQRLFNGYSITTWMVVLNLGSTGLLVSWLMKYADNIVKVFFFKDGINNMKISVNVEQCLLIDRNQYSTLIQYFAEKELLLDFL